LGEGRDDPLLELRAERVEQGFLVFATRAGGVERRARPERVRDELPEVRLGRMG